MFTHAEEKALQSGPVWHGTALDWDKSVDKNITKVPIISERFCGVIYDDLKTKILAYTAYLPTSGQDYEFLHVLSQLFEDIESRITFDTIVIIGLDSNQSERSSRCRTEAMKRFIKHFSLNTILINDDPTFHHNSQKAESQIDHILYHIPEKSEVNINLHEHLCKLNHFSNISSHDALVGNIALPVVKQQKEEEDYTSTYTTFMVPKPKWNRSGIVNYQNQTSEKLKSLAAEFNQPEFIPLFCELYSKMLVISAEQNFETSKPFNEKDVKKKKHKMFISQKHREAYKSHENVCTEWRKQGRPSLSSHPAKIAKTNSQRELQKVAREEEALRAQKNHMDLMDTFDKNINEICNKLKRIRGDTPKRVDIDLIETLNGTFTGDNVLEGFCSNTETLCNDSTDEDHEFLKMCVEDNMTILDIANQEPVCIPHMTLEIFKDIIFKKLKLRKACDINKLTVEHLRYAGDETLSIILSLLNSIIDNINYLSSPQLNTSVASIVYKGKDKPLHNHKSYRQVRVSPLLGRCLYEYIRPNIVQITKPIQNSSQYGFTENITYLMGALQRHEAEKFCIDSKKTFFGCSLDGDSAFEVVNRVIQTRELYCAGEKGQFWLASKNSYQNSQTRIKMNGQLSRSFEETLGVKQGSIKSSDDYKIYVNPLLDSVDSVNLGIWIGPINVGSSACADDEYLITDSQTKLQALLDIAAYYGKMYRVTYGAAKTKVTVVGSSSDMEYYREVRPWNLNGEVVKVTVDNDHLGQIVSGTDQEQKNVELRIEKGRRNLFGMLGPAFAHKCLLSPIVKIHLFRTYTRPIILSGLASFSLRSETLKPLTIFHRKSLRGILNLSKNSSITALHFLLGELPIEAQLHKDVFSLFFSVWRNPKSKIYQIVKYLLENSQTNSRTWSMHVKNLTEKYGIEDPLSCLKRDPPEKLQYKECIQTKICSYQEKNLRILAANNSKMTFLNVSLTGLRGRHHPALSGLLTTQQVGQARIHIKMLAGDYFTYSVKARQSGGSPNCRCCTPQESMEEDICHILAICQQYSDIRNRMLPEFEALCLQSKSNFEFEEIRSQPNTLTQFILDPSSFNLNMRINLSDPILPIIFQLSRDYCIAIHKRRIGVITSMDQEQK